MLRKIMLILHQRPISYYPIHAKIMNSIAGGVALSQIIYWFTAGKNQPLKIYKTDAELQRETHLTAGEMRTVKKKLKTIPFLKITREGVPAKTYYEIDWDEYYSSLVELTKLECDDDSFVESDSTVQLNHTNQFSEINKTITETTQRLTENTSQAPLVTTKVDDDTPENFSATMLEAVDVANHLSSKLAKSIDNYKQPSKAGLHKWAKDIERAIRLDGRTKEQLISTINWIHEGAGSFWIGNVKSGKKLRDQFDSLTAQRTPHEKKASVRIRALEEFGVGNVFFSFLDARNGNRKVKVCIFGEYHGLYDYVRNVYIPKDQADKVWDHIEDNFDKIVSEFRKGKNETSQQA